jgi:hypothetical protein
MNNDNCYDEVQGKDVIVGDGDGMQSREKLKVVGCRVGGGASTSSEPCSEGGTMQLLVSSSFNESRSSTRIDCRRFSASQSSRELVCTDERVVVGSNREAANASFWVDDDVG